MKTWLASLIPTQDTLTRHPWLRPVAGRLLHPSLWRLQSESVARGVAVGTFWAFVIPVAQTLVAAAHCAWWRGNIPAAAIMTCVTNPFTVGFWLWLAHGMGSTVLGGSAPAESPTPDNWWAWIAHYGGPTALGMGLFAVGGAALGYLLVKLVWRLRRVWVRKA
ncbi:DUF2062 domain-containing protein [Curvibacter sp. CHRR-16]|uniref:DUF2062 domain-containing protein n=1 Tax=Curvibacter sp. CHRR-16 TaxID=2835872 RepID=UPI001BD9809C|nr:DUF2062 domain-containing protein [Curvibacter sp. CHRR-16]MBT0570567.1 DUF2062 domain-containing protein [Curvibacter sp. CHRR-16]